MLSSLLERSSNRIKLDRVMVEDKENLTLVTEEKDVQNEVRSHFIKQFQKRKVNINKSSSRWVEAYKPIEKIDENIYKNINDPVSIQEWQEVLRDVKSKSAPGLSGISYPLIRKAGSLAQRLFLVLVNKCIKEGEILVKWKLSQLYPISKSEDWNYNLSNVRPIILLEAFQKVVVRVVVRRLDKILVKFNILKGPNYAGLSGCSTSSLIHIINNLIEETREKNKEI